jgi:hypothetical protein
MEPALWASIQSRINESLADFSLVAVERVQNKALWRSYASFRANFASTHGASSVDERQLFHYVKPKTGRPTGDHAGHAEAEDAAIGDWLAGLSCWTTAVLSSRIPLALFD